MKKEEIETDEKRVELFEKYLSQAKRMIHWESLIQIVNNTWKDLSITGFERLNEFFCWDSSGMFRSHGLTLKNELILSMIEKHFQWEKILMEKNIQLTEEVKHQAFGRL